MLARWSYVSTSRLAPVDAEERIREIVNISISRNRSLGVTGALLFTGRRFAQYIEGEPAAIDQLRASILRDVRHEDVRTIVSGEFSHRFFVSWSLAYAGPSHFVADIVERSLSDALSTGDGGVDALVQTLSEFSIGGHS